jgi:hypothetical protein
MNNSLDQLARNLADGMSRRRAFWQMLTGLGVAAAVTGRHASAGAQANNGCAAFCKQQYHEYLLLCLNASEHCPHDYCAEVPFNCNQCGDGQCPDQGVINGTCVSLHGAVG